MATNGENGSAVAVAAPVPEPIPANEEASEPATDLSVKKPEETTNGGEKVVDSKVEENSKTQESAKVEDSTKVDSKPDTAATTDSASAPAPPAESTDSSEPATSDTMPEVDGKAELQTSAVQPSSDQQNVQAPSTVIPADSSSPASDIPTPSPETKPPVMKESTPVEPPKATSTSEESMVIIKTPVVPEPTNEQQKSSAPEAPAEVPSKLTESKAELQAESKSVPPAESKPAAAPETQPPSEPTTKPPAATKASAAPVKAVPPVATVAPMPKATAAKSSNGGSGAGNKRTSGGQAGDAVPEKKAKVSASASAANKTSGNASGSSGAVAPSSGKTPQQILEYMDKTFETRRRIITKQMPTIPELQQMYPDLFMHKQLLTEFQRITKIDIDQKIQEFCVRFATAVIEMARSKKGAAPVIARWEKAQQENRTLKQYWDMMTALCLLPLHFGENFADMVQEIGEDEEVAPQGKIEPILVARGNIFRTDEFFLIAENTIVQEFEEFTIALASLYSSYWVFNMVYPMSIENTYNYIQRCIVRQKEPGSVPVVCRNFTKALQKWNRDKEGK